MWTIRASAHKKCGEIIIDMPHGWWRVHVKPKGSGIFTFGALPYYGSFPPGTIDPQKICSQLHKIVTKNKQKLSAPIGTVKFNHNENSDHLWYFNDWDIASDLFEQAWMNRESAKNDIEAERLDTLAKFWEKRVLPKQ